MNTQLYSDRYPLTPMQQGMLFHHLSSGDTGVDLEQIVCTLKESLDLNAFRRAWEGVCRHHAVFRTCFHWEDIDDPVQEVQEAAKLPFTVIKCIDLEHENRQQKLKSFLRDDRSDGFDLRTAPLMRITVLEMAEDHFVVVWTFNHIILDGRSFPVVLKEVFESYEALREGRVFEPVESRPYREHIEHLYQHEPHDESAQSFWRKRLEAFTSPTPLPGVEHAPTAPADDDDEDEHGEKGFRLSAATTTSLQEMVRRYDVTLNNLVQGAWAVLLSRYTGESDIVFGAVHAGRRSSVEGADGMVGHFINTLPVRIKVKPDQVTSEWFQGIRADQREVWKFEQTPLVNIQAWSEVPAGSHLFDTILVFDNFLLDTYLRSQGDEWRNRHFELLEKTNFPLALYGNLDSELLLRIAYDRRRFADQTIDQLLNHLARILEEFCTNAERKLGELGMLTEDERNKILIEWNDTLVEYEKENCVHQVIEHQSAETPDAVALSFRDQQLTYDELNAKANQLARHLAAHGVGPDQLVGIYVERSPEMVIAILGVLKAGGAYVPLDPAFPKDRIAYMIEDSGVRVVLTQQSLLKEVSAAEKKVQTKIICLDSDWAPIAEEESPNLSTEVCANHLAYVIYTSGSTGKPKGVMIEHKNVINFFTGMDQRIWHDPPGVWLAVTSLSFDISVLELLYSLARGFEVVLYKEPDWSGSTVSMPAVSGSKIMDFGLFYFASDEGERTEDKYKLLLEGTKFADRNGFASVSIPERHFHAFGGLYPNPSVAGAALASITENIQIRAGSVVLPLHHPIRIAEEWSLVDNLSKGRVGISFAAGWQPADFVIRPENYGDRNKLLYEGIETVRSLWRGEKIAFPDANGQMHKIGTLPRPIQNELPVWITTAGNPETWRSAGTAGANILTHLLGQSVADISEKVALYIQARADAGHAPETGFVTLMLHTFVGDDIEHVRETVRQPMKDYLGSALNLVKNVAHAWTAFKRRGDGTVQNADDLDLKSLSDQEMDDLLEFSFERYFETSGLFGTPESCVAMVDQLTLAGVDEIACLIDFGVDSDTVLSHLYHLSKLRKLIIERAVSAPAAEETIGALIRKHGVTHLQCTPSMASMILLDDNDRDALKQVNTLMIGGEAFPASQARKLSSATGADIINMYGPTETTIWSSTEAIHPEEKTISIGRPIANTQIYILDSELQPVPVSVPGELYIGGDGVVRGYHNRPELTAERFIENPFINDTGHRIYRTGDMASWMPDGRINFLGRVDYQVKMRGYRIELGEIEMQLAEIKGVREAVVIAREDAPGDVRLVAYLIPADGSSIDDSTLRKTLREKLPEYMIPDRFVELEAFPLTPNNKVDRKALPDPSEAISTEQQRSVKPPSSEIERSIVDIWKEVLGTASVSIEDNFFDLGGHSLLAVKAHRRLTEAFQRNISIVDLFRYPTVKALAAFLGEEQGVATLDKSENRGQTRREMMTSRRRARAQLRSGRS